MSRNKDAHKILQQVEQAGWHIEKRKSGHYCIRPPVGPQIIVSDSTSDCRALDNIRAQLRRAGLPDL